MKRFIISFVALTISFNLSAQTSISLDQVAEEVKQSNFTVLENAQRVYQAKETINFNKRNLLPRLNLWNILKTPFSWKGALDVVQDIAPFLVPSNWFKVGQSREFYYAYQEQYRALWANQVMTAKLLYINTLRDIDFLNALKEQSLKLDELVGISETRQVFGSVEPRTTRFLKIKKLEIQEDIRALENLVFEEKKALAYLLGVDQEQDLSLERISLPEVEKLEPLQFDTFVFRALDSAPELTQYKYLKEALKYTSREVTFSFLGASSNSQGMFNNIPVQDGLGFGAASSIRISNSESHILDINKESTEEVLKKSLYNLVNNFNSYLNNIENQTSRRRLAGENYQTLRSHLALGMDIDPLEMLKSVENEFDASISLVNYKYEVVTTMERLKRMIFNGDYNKKESKLDSLLTGGLQ
ncbi:MAG: hypothetical protein CME67_00910 [Halobacteriovoraceae bacterium]|nr:hypothetical protein [Peredibacter sp.]MBI99762.1 hypothetical protein [Halobacteriovoraceae bacterium]|tara:strand:- start:2453 stop:3694 length:1242 start_codon:yes stop_codon:yes gene_type:complete